jgi:hypothetical protein
MPRPQAGCVWCGGRQDGSTVEGEERPPSKGGIGHRPAFGGAGEGRGRLVEGEKGHRPTSGGRGDLVGGMWASTPPFKRPTGAAVKWCQTLQKMAFKLWSPMLGALKRSPRPIAPGLVLSVPAREVPPTALKKKRRVFFGAWRFPISRASGHGHIQGVEVSLPQGLSNP